MSGQNRTQQERRRVILRPGRRLTLAPRRLSLVTHRLPLRRRPGPRLLALCYETE